MYAAGLAVAPDVLAPRSHVFDIVAHEGSPITMGYEQSGPELEIRRRTVLAGGASALSKRLARCLRKARRRRRYCMREANDKLQNGSTTNDATEFRTVPKVLGDVGCCFLPSVSLACLVSCPGNGR